VTSSVTVVEPGNKRGSKYLSKKCVQDEIFIKNPKQEFCSLCALSSGLLCVCVCRTVLNLASNVQQYVTLPMKLKRLVYFCVFEKV